MLQDEYGPAALRMATNCVEAVINLDVQRDGGMPVVPVGCPKE